MPPKASIHPEAISAKRFPGILQPFLDAARNDRTNP